MLGEGIKLCQLLTKLYKRFSNQAGVSLQHIPGFLNCFVLEVSYMCVHVCLLLIMRLLISSGVMWHDMNLILLVQQILQLYRHVQSLSIVDVALELKCVVETNLIGVSWYCKIHYFYFKVIYKIVVGTVLKTMLYSMCYYVVLSNMF